MIRTSTGSHSETRANSKLSSVPGVPLRVRMALGHSWD